MSAALRNGPRAVFLFDRGATGKRVLLVLDLPFETDSQQRIRT